MNQALRAHMRSRILERISPKLRAHWENPPSGSALARALALGIDPTLPFYWMFVMTPEERFRRANRIFAEKYEMAMWHARRQ